MSATMARKDDWVQLEQSNLGLVLNIAKLAIGEYPHSSIEEMQNVGKALQANG
jgi:hypothetical protein